MLKSSENQAATTPGWLLQRLSDEHFGGRQAFDPCPARPAVDGLTTPWSGECFVNPPFNQLPAWIAKATREAGAGCHVILLMPARVSAKYFHQLLLPEARGITIWCRPVAFPPFTTPFSLPILTVEFGARTTASSAPVARWSALWKPGLQLEDVEEHARRLRPGATFLPLFSGVAEACRDVATGAEDTVLLMPPWFSSRYFRALVPRVTEVVFIGPRPSWRAGGSTSLLGSVLVCLAAQRVWDGACADCLTLTSSSEPEPGGHTLVSLLSLAEQAPGLTP